MTEPRLDSDVIVVGGGLAGMCAANRASQLGKSVIVLERGREDRYFCNSRISGGTFHICLEDVLLPQERLYQSIMTATAGTARKELAEALSTDAVRLVRWMQSEGVKFIKVPGIAHHSFVLVPPANSGAGLIWEGRGGDVMLRTFEKNLIRRGSKVLRSCRARSLGISNPQLIEVEVELSGEPRTLRARSIVIADGGFQSNAELVREYISRSPDKLFQRNVGTGIGDGLQMAKAVGAKLTSLDCFYGHVLSWDVFKNNKLWPRPYLDPVVQAGIVVGKDGRRFADEGLGGTYMANMIARLEDPLSSTVVCDHTVWTGPVTKTVTPVNPVLQNAGGTVLKASTLTELAGLIGVPAAGLEQTITEYNTAIEVGHLDDLIPPRNGERQKFTAYPIKSAPFYAIPACSGISYTMGGIAINEFSQILDADDKPIRGLYAAGAAAGGLEGGPHAGYVGGLAKSGVTALRAAEKIAELH